MTFQAENGKPKVGTINNDLIGGNSAEQAAKNLAGDYAARLERMQERLNREISKNNFVKDGVKVPKKNHIMEPTIEDKVRAEVDAKNKEKNSGIDMDLFPEKQLPREQTFSYYRSNRAVEFRIADKLESDLSGVKNEQFLLVKKMNEKVKELDQLNGEKRTLSAKLIEQIKFVRSLQAQLGTSDNGHITEVIDKELEEKFRKEKHLNVQLKEKLKECELEKLRIVEQLKLLEGQKEVTVVTKSDNHVDLDKASMNIDDMLRYRTKVQNDVEEVSRDLDILRSEESGFLRSIAHLEGEHRKVGFERSKLAGEIKHLQGILDDGTALIRRDRDDLNYELRRQRLMLGGKVLANAIYNAISNQKKSSFAYFAMKMKINDS